MSRKGTLEDEVARAEAGEARASRQAGLEPPSNHLGGPPEPWEVAIGDTTARVARQGRGVIEYAAKMNAMGINEQSLAGDFNPVADHVAAVGQDKMRLLPAGPIAPNRKLPAVKDTNGLDSTADEDDDTSVSSGKSSDFSDDDGARKEPSATGDTNAAGNKAGDPEDEEPSDDIGLMGDTDIRHAVEDFDSSNWTMDQLEVSCQTLLEECYASEDQRRRLLSAGMLKKLVETYPSALRWMQRSLEALVNDGLPSMVKGTLAARVFRLDTILAILAPAMADSMTQLNVMARLLRLMVFKMDTAVRLIHFRYALPRSLARYRELPSAIATHKRMTLLMQGSTLRARWRNINADEKNGSLPPTLLHAYLCIVLALIDTETCPNLSRMNRVKMVRDGGLLALAVHFKIGDRSQRLACRILRELAREPLLIIELMNAGVAQYVSQLLPKLRQISIDRLLEALDVLDSMAFSAMRFFVVSAANPDRGQGNSALVTALVADGSSIGGLESEIRLPTSEKVEETVRVQLGFPRLVASLTGLLEDTDVQLYLAGVVILGKLASTVCYHSVLQEVLAYAGRALERLVQGIQSQEPVVPEMSLALFLQLCSRQEGRDGIEATDGAAMLRPLICGRHAQESPVFLRGLACAIALARRGAPGPAPGSTGANTMVPPTAPSGLPLPRAGGVGRSGPAKPHPLDLEGKLYNDLVDALDDPPPAPLEAVRGMVRMGSLEAVMRFLVRGDDEESGDDNVCPTAVSAEVGGKDASGGTGKKERARRARGRARGPHYFSLKQRHACLGAVALHGLVVLAGPHPAIFTEATLRYLCFSIQVAYTDLTVGRLAPGVEYSLVFRSIQLACRALAFLATSGTGDAPSTTRQGEGEDSEGEGSGKEESPGQGPLRRVADSLLSTTAIKEVACMAQMPSRAAWTGDDGAMYRYLERTVSSAAILVASVCPVPAGERDPFERFDNPEDEKASLKRCQALLERLVATVGGPLCSTLMMADNLEIIAHACRALAKLSDANTTMQVLLDKHDVMKAIIRLGPKAPIVLPVYGGEEKEAKGLSLSPSRPARVCDDGNTVGRANSFSRIGSSFHGGAEHAPGQSPEQERALKQTRERQGHLKAVCGKQVRGGEDPRQREKVREAGQGRQEEGRSRSTRSAWSGYDVREGTITDASTRKLCSLPFDYFRLVANVARVPSGRAIVQSSGTFKRCLERLAIDLSGSPAARLATLRCRSEICILVARMAGTYERETGAANDFILCSRYRAVSVMLGMVASGLPDHGEVAEGGRIMILEVARHNAALALAELCRDTLRSVPVTAEAGGISLACRVVKDTASAMPLLKQVMRILQAAGSFPDGITLSSMADPALLRSLNRIANNAYPGFRPAPVVGEVPLSSLRTGTKLAQMPTKQPGTGGTRVSQAPPEEPPPLSAFGLPKPSSPDSHFISELAREVAYLIGAGAEIGAPVSPPGQEEKATTNKQQHPISSAAEHPREAGDASEKSRGSAVGPGDVIPHIEASSYVDGGVASGGCGDLGVNKNTNAASAQVLAPNVSGARRDKAGSIVSGRPGKYLGCGVTSCGGLGVVGEHGDVAGNVPHAAFVLQKADEHEVDINSARDDDEQHQVSGSSMVSKYDRISAKSTWAAYGQEEAGEADEESSYNGAASQDIISMPLTLFSAREASFRVEVVRRKQHYNLGGTGNEIATEPQGREPFHGLTPLVQGRKKTPASAAAAEGGFSTPASRRARAGRSGVSTVLIDVAHSPLMASTRPTGFQSVLGWEHDAERVDLEPHALHHGSQCKPQANGKSVGAKEFVTFARPAAHWSVTTSVNDSPADQAPSKGMRVPGAWDGSVVGRFACRGYLLDPTFADHNPVILHPMLPKIGTGGFSQVPEDSNLENAVASQAAKGSVRGGVEPYRNVVEVLGHCVGVSGKRKAGKGGYCDEQGRPLSPVKFHHVYGSAEKRRQEHVEPHLIPFP